MIRVWAYSMTTQSALCHIIQALHIFTADVRTETRLNLMHIILLKKMGADQSGRAV
jgi:hypothetical protein